MRLFLIFALIVSALCAMQAAPVFAQEETAKNFTANPSDHFDYHSFARLPVLYNGRLQPMDSFARLFAKNFAEDETPDGKTALRWLARTLFDPGSAQYDKIFKIRDGQAVGLEAAPSSLYSYLALSRALDEKGQLIHFLSQRPEKEWSASQRNLMNAYQYSVLYDQLLRSLTMFLPLAIAPPEALKNDLGLTDDKTLYSLLDLKKYSQQIAEKFAAVAAKEGVGHENYTPEEIDMVRFGMQIDMLQQGGFHNELLRIMPPETTNPDAPKEWLSPWTLMQQGDEALQTNALIPFWQDMALAYIKGNADQWAAATQGAQAKALTYGDDRLALRFELELVYNWLHPFTFAMTLYFAALLSLILFSMTRQNGWLYGAHFSLIGALVLHGTAIAMRIAILERPPVGTLYESIIFVAFICVLGSLFFGRIDKDKKPVASLASPTALLTAASCGTLLLFVAEAFATDDTMKMLVAVLNTNFWLITHVLCITIGYGWCLLASFLAHLYLFGAAFPQAGSNKFATLERPIKIIAMIALLFTTVGTILGGIWADQSWGRFWGWDPKENGALAIVMWLIWIFHARLRYISTYGWMAGIAALSIVVALAWFGVNLLGVGLHSYGFITGIMWGLGVFCFSEIAIIGLLWAKASSASGQEKV